MKTPRYVLPAPLGAMLARLPAYPGSWIFAHALALDYFRSIDTIDYPLLKAIEAQVRGYEVERCPLWLWEKAILDGYRAFRCLREQRKGVVIADLLSRSIEFRPIA